MASCTRRRVPRWRRRSRSSWPSRATGGSGCCWPARARSRSASRRRPKLVSSKVDTSYVQGRTAAGGWSQQRFARRRDNQAKAAAEEAADIAVRLLLPAVGATGRVVTGGDRRAVEAILADPAAGPGAARARGALPGRPRAAADRAGQAVAGPGASASACSSEDHHSPV